MFNVGSVQKAKSYWLFAGCLLAVWVGALMAAPPPFVQAVFASGESCTENSCSGTDYCCNGVCCPADHYCCELGCSECPCPTFDQ
jgi:hypothetical protein